jgi:hypothetical protein
MRRLIFSALLVMACGVPHVPPAGEQPPLQVQQAQTCALRESPRQVASGLVGPRLIALDADFVYWTTASGTTPATDTLWRTAKQGTDAPTRLAEGLVPPSVLAAHAGRAYWADTTTRALYTVEDGRARVLISEAGNLRALAVGPRGVVFADADSAAVKAAAPDGSGLKVLATGQLGTTQLRLDEGSAYWLNNEGHKLAAYSLMKAPLEGGEGAEPVSLVGETTNALSFALDATHVFVNTGDRVVEVSKSGEGLRVAVSMQTMSAPFAFGASRLFWAVPMTNGAKVVNFDPATASVSTVSESRLQPVALVADGSGAWWLTG